MIIETKIVTIDGDLEDLDIKPKQEAEIDLTQVIGVVSVDDENQCCLMFPGYNVIIERDYEKTKLQWRATRNPKK